MQVKRQEGIDLFKALGYNATDAWTPDRLTSKLNALPKLIDDDKVKALKKKDNNLAVLLSKIVKAVNEAEGSVTLSPEGKATMAKPKSTKKTKPDPEEEELEDEEDEDEEDNDDDGDESESDDDGDNEEDSDDESEDEEEGDDDESEDEEEGDDDEVAIEVGDSVDCGKLGECTVLKITGDNATVETGKGKKVKVPLTDCVPLDPDSEEVEDDEDDTEDDDEDDSSEDEEDDEDSDESEDEDDEEDTEDDEEEEMAEAVAKKPAAKGKGKEVAKPTKGAKASSGKKASPFKGAGGEGKPGVIASIVEIMQTATNDKPVSKKDILAKLVKRFPDRTEEAMKQTLNIQLPTRLRAEKGMNIEKNENGYYVAAGKPKSKAVPEKPVAEEAPKKKKKK